MIFVGRSNGLFTLAVEVGERGPSAVLLLDSLMTLTHLALSRNVFDFACNISLRFLLSNDFIFFYRNEELVAHLVPHQDGFLASLLRIYDVEGCLGRLMGQAC